MAANLQGCYKLFHIIGTGWYGCHISKTLIENGFEVEIWEKNNEIFSGSSSMNQNRLHLGFHYPRNYNTRIQSREGFSKFLNDYGHLTQPINKNLYAVSKSSLVDGNTYKGIFSHEGYNFTTLDAYCDQLPNIDLVINTDERLIRHDLAKKYWESKNLPINFNEDILSSQGNIFTAKGKKINKPNDLIIDCTWGASNQNKAYFEQFFITFIVKFAEDLPFDAFTLMDGPFFSIFPYGNPKDNLFTLTHVKYGVIKTAEIEQEKKNELFSEILIDIKKYLQINTLSISMIDNFISRKLKPNSVSDARDTNILFNEHKNYASVYSGKIDTIFHSVDLINNELNLF